MWAVLVVCNAVVENRKSPVLLPKFLECTSAAPSWVEIYTFASHLAPGLGLGLDPTTQLVLRISIHLSSTKAK